MSPSTGNLQAEDVFLNAASQVLKAWLAFNSWRAPMDHGNFKIKP
jgi:hypothetical protein